MTDTGNSVSVYPLLIPLAIILAVVVALAKRRRGEPPKPGDKADRRKESTEPRGGGLAGVIIVTLAFMALWFLYPNRWVTFSGFIVALIIMTLYNKVTRGYYIWPPKSPDDEIRDMRAQWKTFAGTVNAIAAILIVGTLVMVWIFFIGRHFLLNGFTFAAMERKPYTELGKWKDYPPGGLAIRKGPDEPLLAALVRHDDAVTEWVTYAPANDGPSNWVARWFINKTKPVDPATGRHIGEWSMEGKYQASGLCWIKEISPFSKKFSGEYTCGGCDTSNTLAVVHPLTKEVLLVPTVRTNWIPFDLWFN